MDPFANYRRHLDTLQGDCEAFLAAEGYDGVVIASGAPKRRFQDDQHAPFVANPHFSYWLPLSGRPHCVLVVRPGCRPQLFDYRPRDFWHLPPSKPDPRWASAWDIVPTTSPDGWVKQLGHCSDFAFIGEETGLGEALGIEAVNPPGLLNRLDWRRSFKSAYELDCLRAASGAAVAGHRAAAAAFARGESEFGIHQAYLSAAGCCETDLPYPNIVALNQHAAVLHYQHRDRTPPAPMRSLLIDAGASMYGYGSDISRTYSKEPGLYRDLVHALDAVQQALVEAIRPGVEFIDLHLAAHRAIAGLLRDADLVRLDPEVQVEQGVSAAFFPHGLGHLLGLQVHDVGGHLNGPGGDLCPPPAAHPFLRLTRPLVAEMVLTVEPGLYFIDSLLEKLRSGRHADLINWSAVDALRPWGGIRIEDDIRVTDSGAENLTRESFFR